jgi:peroxiredoxin Q/BCP
MLKVGDKFPEVTLVNQDGKKVSLKDFRGKKVVAYFYCRNNTPGCTIESQEFQQLYPQFKKKGVEVVGICIGTQESHKKFAEKLGLDFNLLVDADAELSKKVGVWRQKSFLGKKFLGIERTTFVIDEKGRIEKIFSKVKALGHAKAVLESL